MKICGRPGVVRVGAAGVVVAIRHRHQVGLADGRVPGRLLARRCARPSWTRRTWWRPRACTRRPGGWWRRPRPWTRPSLVLDRAEDLAARVRVGVERGRRSVAGGDRHRSGPRPPAPSARAAATTPASRWGRRRAGTSPGRRGRRTGGSSRTRSRRNEPCQWSPAKPIPAESSSRSGCEPGSTRTGATSPLVTAPEPVLTSCRWPLVPPGRNAVGARGSGGLRRPASRRVIREAAPKCTAGPAEQQHPLGAPESGSGPTCGAGEVVGEDLPVAPAVLGVAERPVLRHADAVPPAVAGQREHASRPAPSRGSRAPGPRPHTVASRRVMPTPSAPAYRAWSKLRVKISPTTRSSPDRIHASADGMRGR